MIERLSTPTSREINDQEKREFIDKVRAAVPYTNQRIDNFGQYVTSFDREDGFVSIYIPIMADRAFENEDEMLSDTISVIVRDEEDLPNGLTLVRSRDYAIHLSDNTAQYSESTNAFDTVTGRQITNAPIFDPAKLIEVYNLDKQLGSNVFTEDQLAEVYRVLDDLDPAMRF